MGWATRKVNWKEQYFTPDHPHRQLLIRAISQFQFGSVLEVGCGAGANLALIKRVWPKTQIAGFDINPDAIKTCKELFTQFDHFDVGEATSFFMSDKSTDIIITDACLMYVNSATLDRAIEEIKRVARKHVVFCEFHSESWLDRFKARFQGTRHTSQKYYVHDYKKLLTKHGFYDIQFMKINNWPAAMWQKFGYIITASIT